MKEDDFDYSMMVGDDELIGSVVKTVITEVITRGEDSVDKIITSEKLFINGVGYMDMPTDYDGPVMKAILLHSGSRRLHYTNFKDREDSYCFGSIKKEFKHYYSKDEGETWNSITTNGHVIRKLYA